MKKLYTLLALVITLITFAQAPQGFNYQATVRNSSGALIVNQNVFFKFNLMLNSASSVPVFSETHYTPTDDLGQVNIVIGQGTATVGTFSTINWGTGNYYLGIELNTGSGYIAMGTTQLLSVPYALYANSAGTSTNNNSFTHYIGELYGGGIVVSVWKINGIEHGLIASLVDAPSALPWTTPAFQNTSIGLSAQSLRDGQANTNAIVAQAGIGTNYAAGLCKMYNGGGFTDWYLPAIWELFQCYNSALIINEVLGDTDGFKSTDYYWSSNEATNNSLQALRNFFGFFGVYNANKGTTNRVRAVRRF
ncbi:hypothetical protein [Flavobacterium sp.]|jgi:hypothetical protein|uniref:hypothetical protein n=1 Tax=Flavobacterium sp. TaxID=239 RepID=UPI0037BEF64B